MTSSRRGFFATLAALPAVVMGRKAIAAPWPAGWIPMLSAGDVSVVTGWLRPADGAIRWGGDPFTYVPAQQRTGRRLGS